MTLLQFWISWSDPCRKVNLELVNTYEKFKPKGFEIYAVELGKDKNSWLNAIERDNLLWEHVNDFQGINISKAALIYGVKKLPDNFLIAENGDIIGRNLSVEELDEKLKEMLE